MFFISCKSGDLYGITDTDDGVVEMYSVDDILSIIKLGFDIRGISLDSGKVTIYCKSDNVLNDFIGNVKSTLPMLSMFGLSDNDIVKKITDLAISYGVITHDYELDIDIKRSKLHICSPAFDTFIDCKTNKLVGKIDVCDKSVADLSGLGLAVLQDITLTLDNGLVLTILDIMDEVDRVNKYKIDFYAQRVNLATVKYIGIISSSKTFILITKDYVYAVKVDDLDKVKKDLGKYLYTKTEQADGFYDYLKKRVHGKNVRFVVSKFDKIHLNGRTVANYVNKLKELHPTLHDVYVC